MGNKAFYWDGIRETQDFCIQQKIPKKENEGSTATLTKLINRS